MGPSSDGRFQPLFCLAAFALPNSREEAQRLGWTEGKCTAILAILKLQLTTCPQTRVKWVLFNTKSGKGFTPGRDLSAPAPSPVGGNKKQSIWRLLRQPAADHLPLPSTALLAGILHGVPPSCLCWKTFGGQAAAGTEGVPLFFGVAQHSVQSDPAAVLGSVEPFPKVWHKYCYSPLIKLRETSSPPVGEGCWWVPAEEAIHSSWQTARAVHQYPCNDSRERAGASTPAGLSPASSTRLGLTTRVLSQASLSGGLCCAAERLSCQ